MAKPLLYLDTNILIYLLEEHSSVSLKVADILEHHSKTGGSVITSALTVTEFLASTTDAKLSTIHLIPKLNIINLDEIIAENAALLQRSTKLHIGDAIHLATAISAQATMLFTNDKRLARVAKSYVQILNP